LIFLTHSTRDVSKPGQSKESEVTERNSAHAHA
jgi:hypothetical protein